LQGINQSEHKEQVYCIYKFSFICLQFVVYLPCFNIYFDLLQMETRMPNHWPNAREKGRYLVPLVLGFHILIPSF
jgi:hypothetical protein